MIVNLTPTELLAAIGALVVVVWVWRASARRARAAADVARASGRLVSLAGRVMLAGGLLVAVQWVVITHPGSQWVLLAVLAVPDVLAAYVLTRALTITTMDMRAVNGRANGRRGSRRGDAR
jgi:hypothetical protein